MPSSSGKHEEKSSSAATIPGRRASVRRAPAQSATDNSKTNRYRISEIAAENFRSRFQVLKEGESLGAASLNIPGIHNAVNALAVIALAIEIGLSFRKDRRCAGKLPRRKTSL